MTFNSFNNLLHHTRGRIARLALHLAKRSADRPGIAAATEASRAGPGSRTYAKTSASTVGRSNVRAHVAGSASDVYEPP